MPDSVTVQAVVESAEQAAVAGDFHGAAQHLRDALALQEAELGPSHPDVASTLNNLGVVCERTGNDDEAERCYRRACAIVTAAFPEDHPFVATSRQNLAAFCASHALPIDPVPEAAVPHEPPAEAPPARSVSPPPSIPDIPRPIEPPRPATTRSIDPLPPKPKRSPVVWLVGALVIFVALAFWLSRGDRQSAAPAPASQPSPAATPTPTPAVSPTPASPPPAALSPAPTPAPRVVSTPAPAPREPASSGRASPNQGDGVTVADAQLCRTLSTGAQWVCTHPSDPIDPGPLYFYTRITAPRDAVVVHRWYRNDRVELTRELQIRANQGPGYRTYSRLTIDAGGAGNWRVEVLTTDGKVLREARFDVR